MDENIRNREAEIDLNRQIHEAERLTADGWDALRREYFKVEPHTCDLCDKR